MSGGDSGSWVSGVDSGRWVSGGDSGRWVSGGDNEGEWGLTVVGTYLAAQLRVAV